MAKSVHAPRWAVQGLARKRGQGLAALRLSLSRQIVASVALAAAVFLVFVTVIVLWTIHESAEAAYAARVTLAQTMGIRVDDFLRFSLDTLDRQASNLPPEAGPLGRDDNRLLADLRSRLGAAAIISRMDATGRPIWTAPGATDRPSELWPCPATAHNALTTGKPSIAEHQSQTDSGKIFGCIAAPLRDARGEVSGALVAQIDPGHDALDLLPAGPVGDGIEVHLISSSGAILAGAVAMSPRAVLEHRRLLAELIEGRTAGYRLHEAGTGGPAETHVVAYAPLTLLPRWGVTVEQPRDVVLATPYLVQQRIAYFGGAAVLLAAVAAWLSTRRVVRPLRQLTQAAERFAGGSLDEPVPAEGAGEVGTLAGALESMRRELQRSRAAIEAHNRELEDRVARRTKELAERNNQLASVNAVATTVSSSLATADVLSGALERVLDVTGLERARFMLLDDLNPRSKAIGPFAAICGERCLCARAAQLGTPLVASDLAEDPFAAGCRDEGIRSAVAVPVTAQEEVLGILFLGTAREHLFEQHDLETLSAIGRQIAMALANSKLYEALEERERIRVRLIEQIISSQEGERQRIARDLHDSTGQALTAIIMRLQSLEESAGRGQPERLRVTRELAENALGELRSLVLDLRPVALDDLGLVPAVRAYARRQLQEHGIQLDFTGELTERLPSKIETCLFRVLQEAITNIVRHARAGSVQIALQRCERRVTARVADDGVGFDPASAVRLTPSGAGLGLLGMRERVEMFGGTVDIESAPGAGTVLSIAVEVPATVVPAIEVAAGGDE